MTSLARILVGVAAAALLAGCDNDSDVTLAGSAAPGAKVRVIHASADAPKGTKYLVPRTRPPVSATGAAVLPAYRESSRAIVTSRRAASRSASSVSWPGTDPSSVAVSMASKSGSGTP